MHIEVARATVTVHHAGEELKSNRKEWRHPELPDGTPYRLALVSPPLGDAGHIVSLSALGDALSQMQIREILGLDAAAEEEMRSLVEAERDGNGMPVRWRPDEARSQEPDPATVLAVAPPEPDPTFTAIQVRLLVERAAVAAHAAAVERVMAALEARWEGLRHEPYRPVDALPPGADNPTVDALLRAIRLATPGT
jgi:hypothetical protein